MKSILILCGHRDDALLDTVAGTLACARHLSTTADCPIIAVLAGSRTTPLTSPLLGQVDELLVLETEGPSPTTTRAIIDAFADTIRRRDPGLILLGHDSWGMELGPALAVTLGVPLACDCLSVELDDEHRLRVTRELYGGKVRAELCYRPSSRYVVTLRDGAFDTSKGTSRNTTVSTQPVPLTSGTNEKTSLGYTESPSGDVDIASADRVVAVGRGVKSEEDMAIVTAFAESIGAVMGCSRPVVDRKWLPKDRQIGSSGKSVNPKLYFAAGISGSFQHSAGIKGGTVVAINKDPDAPIFGIADYGIVDDLHRIVPLLKSMLETRA